MKSLSTIFAVNLVLHMAFAVVARADVVLDQEHSFSSSIANTTNGDVTEVAQTFTVGLTGTLDHVEVLMFRLGGIFDPTGDPVFRLYATNNGIPTGAALTTTIIAEGSVPLNAPGFVVFDVSSANIPVNAGDQLAFGITATIGVGPYFLLTDAGSSTINGYSGGIGISRILPAGPWQPFNPSQDHGFRTFVEQAGILLGDVNLDGVVNLLDVSPFVERVSSGMFQAEADINQDGLVNLLDISPFVDLLTGG